MTRQLELLDPAEILGFVREQLGYRLLPMAASDAQVVAALTGMWDAIRSKNPDVPQVVIDFGPGRGSSCTSVGWREVPILELNLAPAGQKVKGRDILDFMLHQAAHALAGPTTTAEGRYHGEAYRQAAVGLGLDVKHAGDRVAGSGWSITSLSRGTQARYSAELRTLDSALRKWRPTAQAKAVRDSRNADLATCSCSPPRKIRVRAGTLKLGRIHCEMCDSDFVIRNAST